MAVRVRLSARRRWFATLGVTATRGAFGAGPLQVGRSHRPSALVRRLPGHLGLFCLGALGARDLSHHIHDGFSPRILTHIVQRRSLFSTRTRGDDRLLVHAVSRPEPPNVVYR